MKKRLLSILLKIILLVFALCFFIPVYITIINAFKTTDDITNSFLSFSFSPTFENLKYALLNPNINVYTMYLNSFIITSLGTIFCLLFSGMFAFYIVRRKNRLAKLLYVYFIIGLMIPYTMIYLPLVLIYKNIGLIGNIYGLIIFSISGNISFSVFVYYNFMKALPKELEEAARVDGAGWISQFFLVVFPLLKPCTAAIGIFVALSIWNDFSMALIIGRVPTITLGVYSAIGPYFSNWGYVFAFTFLSIFPIFIAYIVFQKQFMDGIMSGAIKG